MGTGLLRLFSSKATVGTGNFVVSTTENAAAVSGSLLSFLIPVVVALLLVVLVVWILVKAVKQMKKLGRKDSREHEFPLRP
jgi:flagellar biogenesis protein FliO